MADENPSSNVPQDDDSTKKETIRITLPPKSDQPAVKRETVRINVPGSQSQPLSSIPKKETSKITLPPTTAAASGAVPPPPAPGSPATRPLSSAVPPPKPPPLTGKPTVPLKPAAPPAPSGVVPPPAPSGVVAKPASPKKETARITLPSEAPKSAAPALPKATVKMQQTQPLVKGPTSGTRSQPLGATSQVSVAAPVDSSPAKADTVTLVLSVLAFLAALGAAFVSYSAYSAAEKQQWESAAK
jgi:hypothetical protein